MTVEKKQINSKTPLENNDNNYIKQRPHVYGKLMEKIRGNSVIFARSQTKSSKNLYVVGKIAALQYRNPTHTL